MSQRQARVTQERERERGLSPDPGEASAEGMAKHGELDRAHVGEFSAFDVPPDLFDWVQFGRVGGQPFDRQPRPLSGEVGGHDSALMRAEAVPDENDPLPSEVAFEGAQEPNQRDVLVAPGLGVKVETGAPGVPAEGQGRRDREPLPVATDMGQDRRVTTRRPRPADDGLLRDAAFVFEDEPGVLAPGVFFTAGHRRVTHCRIAASSRSRARRAGRCRDQLSPRKMYQT